MPGKNVVLSELKVVCSPFCSLSYFHVLMAMSLKNMLVRDYFTEKAFSWLRSMQSLEMVHLYSVEWSEMKGPSPPTMNAGRVCSPIDMRFPQED